MRYRLMLPAVCLTVLAACGDQTPQAGEDESVHAPLTVSPADEAAALREAQTVRERFQGDGKARYTPQTVDGF